MVLPMTLMAMLVAIATGTALWVLEKRLEKDELRTQAQIVAGALEASAGLHGSAAEMVEYVQSLGQKTSSIESVSLVEGAEGRIVASTREEWVLTKVSSNPVLRPSTEEKTWQIPDTDRVGFVVPVTVENASINREYGMSYSAVMIIDGSVAAANTRTILWTLGGIALLAGALLLSGFFMLLKRNVLQPVQKIHTALQRYDKDSHRPLQIPYMFPDEIGDLATALKQSMREISESSERLNVLSTALKNGSNEVFVVDADTMACLDANKQALSNLGYTLEEVQTMSVPDIARSVRDPQVAAGLAQQLGMNQEISHVYDHTRKDGTTYPFEFKAILVEGRQRTLLVLGSDVTERQANEAALKASEQRMQLALKGSNDGLFEYEIQAGRLYVSELIRGWLSLDREYLGLDEFLQLVHEDEVGLVADALEKSIQHGSEFNVEFRMLSVSGGHRWVQVRGQLGADDGQNVRLSGFASDITRRKVAENLLNDSVARLGAVLDHIADGIVTISEEGYVCTVNPAVLNMFGTDKDHFVATRFADHLETEVDGSWDEMSDGQVREVQVRRDDGSFFPAELAVRKMDNVANERFTVVIRDVTERKQHEDRLRAAMEEAQAATQAKGEFLATMSHEIRTPMNGVLGMTQLLLDMKLDQEQRETAEIIFSSGEALLTLINDILDYSKIEAGKLQLESIPFDFRTAIREVMELLASSARRRSLDLYVDYSEDQPFAFVGDVGRFRQILLNLVGNAIKFTETGHVIVAFEALEQNDQEARIRLSVKDTGVGVSPEAQSRLFESFTQADASTTRKFGGTGLGLAISKQLAELMGGAIGVVSEEGEGAEFWVEVTLPKTDKVVASETLNVDRLKGKRVLAVDDNPVGLKIVKQMVESFGMTVDVTEDPQNVPGMIDQAHAESRAYDVVALDYNMPVVDGLTVATNIRDDERNANTRVVLLTSSDLKSPSGLDGYALKPLMRAGLARLLERALFGREALQTKQSDDDVERTGESLRVLLAEDNPVNQRVAIKMLEKLGCRVDVAANGREAIDMWEQFPYAMIFMDCQMPELDGISATEEIRRREDSSDRAVTPIIAMTANAMASDEEDCLQAGMDDYASKPIKLGVLSDMVKKWHPESPGALH